MQQRQGVGRSDARRSPLHQSTTVAAHTEQSVLICTRTRAQSEKFRTQSCIILASILASILQTILNDVLTCDLRRNGLGTGHGRLNGAARRDAHSGQLRLTGSAHRRRQNPLTQSGTYGMILQGCSGSGGSVDGAEIPNRSVRAVRVFCAVHCTHMHAERRTAPNAQHKLRCRLAGSRVRRGAELAEGYEGSKGRREQRG